METLLEQQINFSYVPKSKICLCKELMLKDRKSIGKGFIPFIVETPNPYLANLSFYQNDKVKSLMVKKIKNQVEILMSVLDDLNISLSEAIENDYTLIETSILQLLYIAWEKGNTKVKSRLNKLLKVVPKSSDNEKDIMVINICPN